MYNTRDISARRIRHAGETCRILENHVERIRVAYAWQQLFAGRRMLLPAYILRPAWFSVSPRLASPRKGKREGLSREWPDVSPARLCLTPRIFPLNFPDARIYHRLHLPEKLAPRTKRFPLRSPRDFVKRVSSRAKTFDWYLSGSTNEATVLIYLYKISSDGKN